VTLSTNVYVLDELVPHELFRYCQTLLSKYDDQGRTWRQMECSDTPDSWASNYPQGTWSIANKLGQGLPAILDITYRPGAPLATAEQASECTSDCDTDEDYHYHPRACWLDIDLDTSYSFTGPHGIGCGQLHALLVAEAGQWLDERNVRWEWRNEFTGEVHGGDERYARLLELGSGGDDATAWFTNIVKPAIEAHATTEGAEVEWS
jgi:hypothetical protein